MSSTIALYRNILKNAKTFPSRNRDGIIREIKISFRENKAITDESKIESCLKLAREGLAQLSMYSNLRSTKGDWKISLTQEPMPSNKK